MSHTELFVKIANFLVYAVFVAVAIANLYFDKPKRFKDHLTIMKRSGLAALYAMLCFIALALILTYFGILK